MISYLGGYINNKKLLSDIDILSLYPWIAGVDAAMADGLRHVEVPNAAFNEYRFEKYWARRSVRRCSVFWTSIPRLPKRKKISMPHLTVP